MKKESKWRVGNLSMEGVKHPHYVYTDGKGNNLQIKNNGYTKDCFIMGAEEFQNGIAIVDFGRQVIDNNGFYKGSMHERYALIDENGNILFHSLNGLDIKPIRVGETSFIVQYNGQVFVTDFKTGEKQEISAETIVQMAQGAVRNITSYNVPEGKMDVVIPKAVNNLKEDCDNYLEFVKEHTNDEMVR